MGDSGFIITGLFIMMIIIAVLAVVILVKLSGRSRYGGDMTALRRELREEIKRSRQETIETVGSSVRNLSDILSQNQREAVNVQSRRLSDLNRQLADTSMGIEQRLENIRISMENKVSMMTEENNRQLTEMRNTVDEKLAEDAGGQDRQIFHAGQ